MVIIIIIIIIIIYFSAVLEEEEYTNYVYGMNRIESNRIEYIIFGIEYRIESNRIESNRISNRRYIILSS